MRADLHMHTTESDGRLTREALFKRAEQSLVDIISITDHDTCLRVKDNHRLAKQYGLTYIPGIELSTLYEGKSVHLLGYFRDDSYQSSSMLDYYAYIKNGREQRAQKFIENLKTYFNIHITYEDVLAVSHGIIGRPHLAKAIMNRYPEYAHTEIFDKFIGDHTKAYVPSTELHLEEGLALLRKHDIFVSLAHPKLLKSHIHDQVLAYDYDAIEAIYGINTPEETKMYKKIAEKSGLLITAGSDFHGIENDKDHAELGSVALENDALKKFLKAMQL